MLHVCLWILFFFLQPFVSRMIFLFHLSLSHTFFLFSFLFQFFFFFFFFFSSCDIVAFTYLPWLNVNKKRSNKRKGTKKKYNKTSHFVSMRIWELSMKRLKTVANRTIQFGAVDDKGNGKLFLLICVRKNLFFFRI